MTKRSINIILVITVLTIWGKVVYSFFLKPDVKQVVEPISIRKTLLSGSENQSSFVLKSIQRDPFLGTFNRKNVTKHINPKKVLINNKKPIEIKLPKLDYYGYVKNKKTGKTLLVIKLNNKLNKNIYLHSKHKDIYYQRIDKDTLFINFNKKTYKLVKH